MLQAIKGYYDHGEIVLEEKPVFDTKVPVLVIFLEEVTLTPKKGGITIGGLGGKVTIPDDFNDMVYLT